MGGFQALLFQVAEQQLSVAATRRILGRIQACFAGALPTPAEFLAADPERLGAVGLSRRKLATLRAVAQEYVAGTLSDEVLQALPDQEIEERLTAISGIGPWTAHGFLIIALDRPDVVLPGDLALRKSIRGIYALDHLPSEEEVLEIAEPWRPYRSLATAYLFQAAFGGGAAASD
jgi:DNA-3-methyladenine glycosylase II